jgi:hypothetical protein
MTKTSTVVAKVLLIARIRRYSRRVAYNLTSFSKGIQIFHWHG